MQVILYDTDCNGTTKAWAFWCGDGWGFDEWLRLIAPGAARSPNVSWRFVM